MRMVDIDKLEWFQVKLSNGEIGIYIRKPHINDLDIIDAEPVKHGHWIERQEPLSWCEDDVDVFYECSICGSTDCGEPPYCSYCGAKMAVEPHASCINCKHSTIIPDGDMIWVDCPKRDGRCSYHNMFEPREASE